MLTLKGQFLVAMPGMSDDRFHDAVIYLVGHGEDGAMGLMINQPLEDTRFGDILDELNLSKADDLIRLPSPIREREVLNGGPVQKGRGFVLHSPDYFREGNSYAVDDKVCLTATIDILRAMAFKHEPTDSLFALGYCGWAPGQLEGEIAANGWLTVPFSHDLLFGSPVTRRYDMALSQLGITRASLSGLAGHA